MLTLGKMKTSQKQQVNVDLDRTPSPVQGNGNTNALERLTFVDFSPYTNSSYVKSLFSKPDSYSELICRVNDWLEAHPEWQAKNVESILFEPVSNLNKSVVYGSSAERQKQFFAIRVWLCPREDQLQPIQKLKVLNIIPKMKITGCNHQQFIEQKPSLRRSFSSLELPNFESVNEIVPHLNKVLRENKYFGQILNIETISMPIRENKWSVDTENLEWPINNCKGVLNILRVHFNERIFMPHETVEILDFVPKVETWNAPLAVPNLESFTSVLKRASHALRQRSYPFRFLNCRTVYCPTRSSAMNQIENNFIDPKRTFYSYSEWFDSRIFSAKYIRIVIAKQQDDGDNENRSSNTLLLNCKIFVPIKRALNEMIGPDHEMQTIKDAIQNWFLNTDANVLSVETEIITSAITWTSSTTLIDSCLSLNHKYPCDILLVFKVYIDGHFIESSKSINDRN